jgi:hypothetical protein
MVKNEKNMIASRKSNLLGFLRETTSRVGLKARTMNTDSLTFDPITTLTEAIRHMEYSFTL